MVNRVTPATRVDSEGHESVVTARILAEQSREAPSGLSEGWKRAWNEDSQSDRSQWPAIGRRRRTLGRSENCNKRNKYHNSDIDSERRHSICFTPRFTSFLR